uniref:Reticulon-like protein n=1 Tax=Ananas comosus var. bracteatus TaxID=296719 RepID=A0A6V7QVK6_ANACO
MGSSIRPSERPKSLHELLGGGFVADVMLWRRRNVTIKILLGSLAAWWVFEVSGYTVLSLLSNVLLLLISILFVWAKAAWILNRYHLMLVQTPPPMPVMRISEEVINEVALHMHSIVNMVLSIFHNIALGKDTELFYGVAVYLWLISIIGSLTDFPTLCYISLVTVLTVPALYEKYEDCIDKYLDLAYTELLMYERVYERVCFQWYNKAKRLIMEITKES